MTTLAPKPHLLRADTIDLQSHDNPSAKDHSRGQYHLGYSHAGSNAVGQHHVQALRDAKHDSYREAQTSPRIGGLDHGSIGPNGQTHMYDEEDEDEDDHAHKGMNGAHHGDGYDDREGDDSQDDDMDDELLDKISSSPSIEDEDIDFEFVYALHTFVATVEGQANATKGDTMVLLDDSNSYWWLVRVVKDGSIGYLPAEHIETPTERLARLNKHRNIDLSAAMLGDNPEKSKNPLKKAMRRRNAKTVNFAPPTYYEPEERTWSDEEDEGEDEGEDGPSAHDEETTMDDEQQNANQTQQAHDDQVAQQAQQVNHISEPQRAQPASATIHRVNTNDEVEDEEPSSPVKVEALTPAPLQTNAQNNVQRSRNGNLRNTDSFFKDDTAETKKISLTPRLLSDDSANANQSQNVQPRTSLDTFDKMVGEDKSKDNKKKEKKSMFGGIFKRSKDKTGKGKADAEDSDRFSEDSGRSPQSKESMDSDLAPERKPSKLQKAPPVVSPKASPVETRAPQNQFGPVSVPEALRPAQKPQTEPVQVQAPAQPTHLDPSSAQQPSRFPSLQEKRSVFAPITGALRSKNSSQDMDAATSKPIYSKRAKERFAIDESDSDDESTPTAQSSILHRSISPLEHNEVNRRPDSEMRVSPLDPHEPVNARPPLSEQKPQEKPQPVQQLSSTPTSPSDQTTASTSKQSPSIPTHTPSTSRSTPTWSDASLRSYMDSDQDIRDLLIIVHDKSNITPVGPEHPLMNGLFAQEKTKLADMQSQLDSMLMTWLSKKNPSSAGKI